MFKEGFQFSLALFLQKFQIAKLSHGNKSNKNAKEMIDMLMRLGHDSVFEFGGATFYVETSIMVERQWLRHRHFSFLERSLRYVKLDDEDIKLAVEPTRFTSAIITEFVDKLLEEVAYRYNKMIENDVPAEVARSILPLGLQTQFYVSGNLREWLHFLDLRLSSKAQYEMRKEAEQVLEQLSWHFPYTIEVWKKYRRSE